jgi:DNA-binding NtrC family response regulator
MPIEKIIVLEDDLIVRRNLEQQLRQQRYDVAATDTIAGARELLAKDTFDLLFLDLRLPDGEGTDLLRELQAQAEKPLVVMITGFGSVESAVECMRNGAFDYMLKPFSSDQLQVTLKKAENFNQLLKVNAYFSNAEEDETGYELQGVSPAMENLRQLIRKVARTQATVLIAGESGTGKELVARALYRQSPRHNAPFIKVNCAAIPENLIESEFFGHEKGSFTGAFNKREGRFELAHSGTILLDEVSEISPQVQAKLLRVLQERELERVGGNRTIKVDVRVLATTNRHLEESVERKEFRQDLFSASTSFPSTSRPCASTRKTCRIWRGNSCPASPASTACACAAFPTNAWPSCKRTAGRATCANCKTSSSAPSFCAATPACWNPSTLVFPRRPPRPACPRPRVPEIPRWPRPRLRVRAAAHAETGPISLFELEKRHILSVMEKTASRTAAAKVLGISIRTLRNKLRDYGVRTRMTKKIARPQSAV